jgi:hypothetical protein
MKPIRSLIASTLVLSLLAAGCVGEAPPAPIADPVLDAIDTPADFTAEDEAKGEVLTLTFVTVVAVALIATVAAITVYESTRADLERIVGDALERRAFEEEIRREEAAEAAHLNRAINRGFYRNNTFGRYWVSSANMIALMNTIEQLNVSTTLGFGAAAKHYTRSLRVLASRARLRSEYRDGGCVKAKVRSKVAPYTWHQAAARYTSPEDVLAAASYASLKAMSKCAMLDAEVLESFYGMFPDSPPSFSIDTFIEYGWKSTQLLYTYGQRCSFPPALAISKDPSGCQ